MRLASRRTAVAALAAPWVPAAIPAILAGRYAFSDDWWAIVLIAAAVGYVGVVLVALPATLFLAGRGSLNLIALAVTGALGELSSSVFSS